MIMESASQIENITGCLRNCRFMSYKKVDVIHGYESLMLERGEVWMNILLVNSEVDVKEETLIYDLESLISDIGGSLGLFLGFSVMMIWDGLEKVIIFIIGTFKK